MFLERFNQLNKEAKNLMNKQLDSKTFFPEEKMFLERFNQLIEDANNFILQRLEESKTLSPVEKIICLPNASATEVFNNPDILYSLPKYNQYYAIIGIHKKEDGNVVLQTREIENYKNTEEYYLDGLDDFGLIVLADYLSKTKN